MQKLYATATGKVRVSVIDSSGEEALCTLPITIVSGIGKRLFSSGAAQTKGFKTTISENSRLENDKYSLPLQKTGQLFPFIGQRLHTSQRIQTYGTRDLATLTKQVC